MRAVVCSRCGQQGDQPPGFKLEEYEHLEAVIFDLEDGSDAALVGDSLPQRLVCKNCSKASPVPRGSVQVRTP